MQVGKPSVNPLGRPRTGLQSVADRLNYWLETKTIGEIKKIINSPKTWNELPSIDAMVAKRIKRACDDDGETDFNMVLDRLIGRPVQPIAAEFKHTHGLADRLKQAKRVAKGIEEDAEQIVIDQITSEPEKLLSGQDSQDGKVSE